MSSKLNFSLEMENEPIKNHPLFNLVQVSSSNKRKPSMSTYPMQEMLEVDLESVKRTPGLQQSSARIVCLKQLF